MSPSDSVPAPLADSADFDAPPPVVVAVFDQLPLASLLDREGELDRTLYPHFAALAGEATWFRNASAVTEATTYALPAIVTGNYPARPVDCRPRPITRRTSLRCSPGAIASTCTNR